MWEFRIDFQIQIKLWLQHYFEHAVIAFGIGIGLYFALPREPLFSEITFLAVFAFLVLFLRGRRWRLGFMISALMFFLILGLARSVWHTQSVERPRLPEFEKVYDVKGRIVAVEKSGPRLRWVVKVKALDNLPSKRRPEFIRVTTFDKTFSVGDAVSFRAQLRAPPSPVIPDGYNPSFRAFYQKVGGYGFMLSRPEPTEIVLDSQIDAIKFHISKIRYQIAKRVLEAAPKETAGLQVALLTGIRAWVPDEQTEALRAAGMAHILAISGLHMGLVTGSIYGIALFCLVRIERLARARDIRKIAAGIGIIAATAYLILSGASVATQRAYIMACIIFIALILDRQAISIRSVSVAAFLTLWMHPEALLSPGFQMSFSAVLALVVVYRYWDSKREYQSKSGLVRRAWNNFKALSVTSLVAGTATSGFAVLHFNRIAVYGFFANLLAMPIFTFWVMPLAILVYVSMVFGLETLPLWLMGKGLSIILIISKWIEGLPGAVSFMSSGPLWVMGVFGLAFIGLCIGPTRLKWASTAAMILCFATITMRDQADMRISTHGAVAFWDNETEPMLYVDKRNTDRYGRQEFVEAMGLGAINLEAYDGTLGLCDEQACLLNFKGKEILIANSPSAVLDDCDKVELIILPKRKLGKRIKRLCSTMILDAEDFSTVGAHSLFFKSDEPIEKKVARHAAPLRPWH